MKFSLKNDYSEACHPNILQALLGTNTIQQAGYGEDDYCDAAKKLFIEKIDNPNAKIHFVSGGTQANLIVISAMLRPHESVIAANTGHILNNETGAIEATGHKINSVFTEDGKLTIEDIQSVLNSHCNVPHQVKPKMVYISNSTEVGTLYNKEELEVLFNFCQSRSLILFLDGARLSQALAVTGSDLSLKDIANLTDVFYFGGTKNGALLGEAIIINNPNLQEDFAFHIKQKGALLAKGRLLGIQFLELLRDDLYLHLGSHANVQAMKIKSFLKLKGFDFLTETYSNQIFPVFNKTQIEKLSQKFDFYEWKKMDEDYTAIRLITSWATPDEVVDAFIDEVSQF